ncbi:cytoskeleton-associated protein 2 [Pyxicephalus adspersus]|uniref:Cytoskeleton-associated protein 2 C-terminal domain-containing protein n=1 Tax=Pyxicephalus adspersus TaxID=30357 RepID=A0AAV3B4D0_PYXAD|nr:TPA: hypothetical protein GDO54_000352 [Pyxicephalus adspersus]
MASVTAARKGVRPGYTEQKKKITEENLSRKTIILKSKMNEKQSEIRSPLMERSNKIPQKKPGPVKAVDLKSIKPTNKENMRLIVNKEGKSMTFSQSFLKTKTLKEKQLKDGKQKEESTKAEQKPEVKPVLGAYRGKIVQSKINSFRKPTEITTSNTTVPERKTITKSVPTKPNISATRNPMQRPSSVKDTKAKKQTVVPKKSQVASQLKTFTKVTIKNNVQPTTTRRTTHVIPTTTSQTKASTRETTTRKTTHLIPTATSQAQPSNTKITRKKFEHVTMRRTTQILTHKKPLEANVQQGLDDQKTDLRKGSDSSGIQNKKRVTVGPVGSLPTRQQPSVVGKYPKVNESAEDRKARLAEWRASKGKVIKRPPSSVALLSTFNVQKEEPAVKSEPEEPQEEPRQLFWATMAEEDEQELFTLKVNQIFAECQKLIDEGIPKEEILSILEKQIENIPEAKKLSRYWECLARIEQREGQPYKVIEVCEAAVVAGAQPLEELRTILANTLEQLKTEHVPEENQKKECEEDAQTEEEAQTEEVKPEVKCEPEDSAVKAKIKRGRRRAMKYEPKSPSTPEKNSKSQSTPENGEDTSSVIKFNITTTPHLEKMRKLQMMEGDSSIKGYKFLTPVRRSSRLERKSHIFPDMLKDHDPCISGIAQLEELEDTQSCPNAYIFRKNEALKEINAGSLTKK